MTYQSDPDIDLAHLYLSALRSGYQGLFAYFGVLCRLTNHPVPIRMLHEMKAALDDLAGVSNALFRGDPVILAAPDDLLSREARDVVRWQRELLRHYTVQLESVRGALLQITPGPMTDPPQQLFAVVVAGVTSISYARESYIRSMISFAETFALPEIGSFWAGQLPAAAQQIAEAHELLRGLLRPGDSSATLRSQILLHAAALPAVLACQLHELRTIEGSRRGRFEYSDTAIPGSEHAEWAEIGFTPVTAGYWHAFEICAIAAVDWIEHGFFEAAAAGPWHARGFKPHQAERWVRSGHSPVSAAALVREGIADPASALH